MKAINLKCLGLVNPLGIDVLHPRVTWNIENGQRQSAFEVIYSINNGIKKTSGIKISSSMYYVFEDNFNSRDFVTYIVRVYENNNYKGYDSEPASFEFSLLSMNDFKAKFVAGDYPINTKYRYPISCFRKKFLLNSFNKARLYISSLGNYDLILNKRKITSNVLTPGYTNFNKRLQYQTYDVTEFLKIGFNEVEIEVSDGYFRGSNDSFKNAYSYGKETAIIFQFEIYHDNNVIEKIYSDETVEFSNDGKYIFADLKDGEIIDASKTPSYNANSKVINYKTLLSATNSYPLVKHEKFIPKILRVGKNQYMLDFDQLITGFLGFSFIGNSGDTLFIRLGASIDERGKLIQNNIQKINSIKEKVDNFIFKDGYVSNVLDDDPKKVSPLEIISYKAKSGENNYETKFSLFSFKYALVETNVDISKIEFYAIAVYRNMKQIGKFVSNNNLLNNFFNNSLWTIKDLSLDFPFSTPFYNRSGDFKNVYTLFKSSMYVFDYYPLMYKYLYDIFDSQKKNYEFSDKSPCIIDKFRFKNNNQNLINSGFAILIPYLFYSQYGDFSFIKDNYDKFIKYGKSLIKKCNRPTLYTKNIKISSQNQKYLLNSGIYYYDSNDPKKIEKHRLSKKICLPLYESTLLAHVDFKALSSFATLLNWPEEALFIEYENGTKYAFNELLIKKGYSLNTEEQSRLIMPIYFNILSKQYDKFAKEQLVENYKSNDFKLNFGNYSAPFFLFSLFKSDKKLALESIKSKKPDKWLYLGEENSSTLFEKTIGDKLNFYSKLSLVDFMFSKIAGINILKENYFKIEPYFDKDLSNIYCEYNSIYGLIKVSYNIIGDNVSLNIVIPGNCDAELILPNEKIIHLHSGTYNLNESF